MTTVKLRRSQRIRLLYSSRFLPVSSIAQCILIQLLRLLTALTSSIPKKKKGGPACGPLCRHSARLPSSSLTASVHLRRYFSVNQSSGELTLRQDTPPGSYWLRVGVSDGVWPDVISGVRVHVRDLEEKAILSSGSLRLTGKRSTPNSPDGRLELSVHFLTSDRTAAGPLGLDSRPP